MKLNFNISYSTNVHYSNDEFIPINEATNNFHKCHRIIASHGYT